MFWTEDWKWVPQLPEEIHKGEPHHTGKKEPLSVHYRDKIKITISVMYSTVVFQWLNVAELT